MLLLSVVTDSIKHTNLNCKNKWGIAQFFEVISKEMKKEEVNLDVVDEHKIYKEKPYNNSNGDPFGVSINGRSKEYIQAHNKLRDLMKKGKIYDVEYKVNGKNSSKKGKIRILSVVATKTIVDATVEVIPQEGSRGNVQLKSHNPSTTKKKGATTELRKHPDYEYSQVEVLCLAAQFLLENLYIYILN